MDTPNKPQQPLAPTQSKAIFTADEKNQLAKQFTKDGFDNFVSRLGLNNDNTLSAGLYTFNMMTWNRIQLEAAYRGSWVVGVIVDAVAEDMTRAGIDITTNEGVDDIKDLQAAISRYQIWNSLCDTIKWSRLYGGALAVIQIEGQDLSTPLNLSSVGKDAFQGLVVYDRWQLNPSLINVIKSGPDTGLPEYYSIVNDMTSAQADERTLTGQLRVHHSRVIRMDGIKLPYFQAITNMMWGESNLERLWDRLISFDNVTMSSAQLVDRANLRTVGVDGLREIIAAGGEAKQGLLEMFEMMRSLQVNEGLTLIDKNDTFASTAYTFAGLSDMILQFGQQIAGASGIPLVRLFGQSPAGLSATGEADLRMYYDNINAQQNAKLRRGWDKLLKIMYQSVFGKPAPKDLEFKFTPLWQMSAMDKAQIAKLNAETIIGAHESGLISAETAMEELRESSDDTGLFSNISDEDIADAALEEPPLPDPQAETPKEGEQKPVTNLDEKPTFLQRVKTWYK